MVRVMLVSSLKLMKIVELFPLNVMAFTIVRMSRVFVIRMEKSSRRRRNESDSTKWGRTGRGRRT